MSAERIVVIEPHDHIRHSIATSLDGAGFEVIEGKTGAEALELTKQVLPSLVICDVDLADRDGYDVLREIRETDDTTLTPIILMCGDHNSELHRKGMELGADDFLFKPIHPNELLIAVHGQLAKYQKLLKVYRTQQIALEETKQRLTLMMAHELRTPLSGISMSHELLINGMGKLGQDQQLKLLDTMGSSIARLRHLVDQMVLVSQLQSGNIDADHIAEEGRIVDLWQIVEEAATLAPQFVRRQAEDIDVVYNDGDAHLMVRCDRRSLAHAIAEIIANAISFSPQGGKVLVSQWVAETSAGISVQDFGQGMPRNMVIYAMEDFGQLDREANEQQGIGMGLSLAKRIIQIHGGVLAVNSQEGAGTNVVIGLPIWTDD